MPALLAVDGLTVRYPGGGPPALDRVSLDVAPGECVGLAGGSGSGKTTLAHAVLRLLPAGAQASGRVLLEGEDVAAMSWGRLRAVRWAGASIVFQGAQHSLDPLRTLGAHVAGPVRLHQGASRAVAAQRTVDLLLQVGLDPGLARRYPHQLSGGQRQRGLIAMALACSPRLMVADEPTTALDPPARAAVLALLGRLVRERGLGLLLISHDLPQLASSCDRIAVLQRGRLVEYGPARQVLERPRHPYPAALIAASGRFGDDAFRPPPRPTRDDHAPALLRVSGLTVAAPGCSGGAAVVRDIALELHAGEVLALIGEVGAGKTTLARALVGLVPAAGEVVHEGVPLARERAALRALSRRAQYVPQEPMSALSPRHSVRRAVAEGPRVHGVPVAEAARAGAGALRAVGLEPVPDLLERRPHQLSAGQQQRVVLAAALALRPRLLIVDEPVACLDAEARLRVLRVLLRLRERGAGVVLVTHDLTAAWQVADRVAVLQAGRLVEQGPAERVLTASEVGYTRRLVGGQLDLPAPGAGSVATNLLRHR